MSEFNGQRSENQNPPFPRRFLRLLSMGCGISKFDPKEVVEATTNSPHNPPHSHKSTTSNCFTGESKPLDHQQGPNHHRGSPDNRFQKADDEKVTTMKMNVKRRGSEEFEDDRSDDDDENERNCREICRGGSPSFREYCIDSDSRSRSMRSEDYCEGDQCPNERALSPEKEKGLEGKMGKKERRGKGIRVRNFLSASRRQQHQNVHDSSQKLLAKAS